MKPPYTKLGILCSFSFILLVVGISMTVYWSSIFFHFFQKMMVLTKDSTSYNFWKQTPIPMYLKVYLFNWTNPEAFGSSKPNFEQKGPYVFREVDTKIIKSWNDNGTVTFQQRKDWTFEESLSIGNLSDKITNLNPIAAAIAYTIKDKNVFLKEMVNLLLNKVEKSLVITKTARELLFEGYADPLLKVNQKLNFSKMNFDKFAWFYKRNGSEDYDGTFNMLTGSTDLYDLALLKQWKYSDRSSAYPEECSAIDGSLGDFWPPLLNNKTITIFSPDICTTLTLEEDGIINYAGLEGKKFVSTERMLDNGTKVPSRKCYCGKKCQPSGTLDVSSCKFGAPAFISLPHFYLADESYRSGLSGLDPNETDHEFYIVIEPRTGMPMQVHAAMQLNFLVQPDPHLKLFEGIPTTYIPMMWFKQVANISEELAYQAKLVKYVDPVAYPVFGAMIGIGVLLAVIAVTVYIRHKYKGDDTQDLIPDNEE